MGNRLNQSLISELQSKTFKEKVDSLSEALDLSWRGFNRLNDSEDSFIKKRTQAHINRALFWFASKPLDYVRSSTKGGVLYSLLGQLNNDTNLSLWETMIKDRFNMEFSNDLEIVYLKLNTDKTFKRLNINMIVKDKVSNSIFPITTEASK